MDLTVLLSIQRITKVRTLMSIQNDFLMIHKLMSPKEVLDDPTL